MTGTPASALFNDGKAPDALRTIGEVAKALGIRQHVLRYWEEQMPMLRPVKRSGGRRYYRPEDIDLVRRIDRMVHHEGYTLRGARLVIEAGTTPASVPSEAVQVAPVPEAQPVAPRQNDEILSRLRAIRADLAAALAAA